MKVVFLYVGSSLLAPLRGAEQSLNDEHKLDLTLTAHNFGAPFTDDEWQTIAGDLASAEVVFVIHVMDGENAARLLPLLDRRSQATVVINCMPELMKRTRMGRLDLERLPRISRKEKQPGAKGEEEGDESANGRRLLASVSSWIGRQAKGNAKNGGRSHDRSKYLKWAERLPRLLRFVPSAGPLRDAKNYLLLMSYFLQPTPNNIRAMILLALKEYAGDERVKQVEVLDPEALP